ncbi:MAG: hypothetical protein ALECFALPRED_004411 [Alectoria fallacina]|uniref:Uncharacterized protein n=1 Tax=Alectoria fallacina TaxID=1903189 RepID=A0A8H3IWE2_9LECA|nr:MAG: hypothetical protein ALECFALPRED_004411 [Alectoria fallacina]
MILRIVQGSKSAFRWVLKGRPHPGTRQKDLTSLSPAFNASPQRSHSARYSEQSARKPPSPSTFTTREPGTKPARACIFSMTSPTIKKPHAPPSAMLQKLIELATVPYHRLTSRTPSPAPSSSPVTITTMKAVIPSKKPSRVSPRANKGLFTSTKLDEEQTPLLPQKAGKKKPTNKAPSTKKTPKAIRKARAPKKQAPSPPSWRSRKDRAADRAAPARAAVDPKAK